ncbi:MAG: hypothetical protein O2943_02955 [Actinomycetota bacterium]|nr:hypothetical protein [Actinomycetota bacterium]
MYIIDGWERVLSKDSDIRSAVVAVGLIASIGARVVAVDRSARRLDVVLTLGASAVVSTDNCEDEVDLQEARL